MTITRDHAVSAIRFPELPRFVAPVVGVVAALVLWQLLAMGPLQSNTFPTASSALSELASLVGTAEFWRLTGQTMAQAVTGFVIGSLIGIVVGLLIGLSELGYRATSVLITIVKPIPPIVILPIAVLIAGASAKMSIALVVIAMVPTMIVTAAAGVRDVDPVLLDTARSYRLSWLARLRRIVLPSTAPFIASQLRIGISWAVVIAVMAEIVGGAPGLGSELETSRSAGLIARAFALVIAMGLIGMAIHYVLVALERRALHWHPSIRGAGSRTASARVANPSGPRLALRVLTDRCADAVGTVVFAAKRRVDPVAAHLRRLVPDGRPLRRFRRPFLAAVQIGVPVGLGAWWWTASANSTDPFFPPLQEIWRRFHEIWIFAEFGENAVPSLRNLVVGFGLAVVVGIVLGLMVARVDWLGRACDPVVNFFRAIPGVAYIPILIAMIGFTAEMRILAIVLVALFPVMIATTDGVRSMDSTMNEMCRSYRISQIRRLFSVDLPAAAPRIFVGMEVALVVSLVVMIASELMGTSEGIGAQILLAQQSLRFSDMWAGIVLLAIIGIVSNLIFQACRYFVLAWYRGAQEVSKAS